MEFIFTPELREHIQAKKMDALVVEVAETTTSDLDVQEIFISLCKKKTAEYLKEKKQYRGYETDVVEVLLPNYRLEYEKTITFKLVKKWIFKTIKYEGISF